MKYDPSETDTKGKRIIFLRKMIGWTATLLSEKSRIGYSTLKQWETEYRDISDKGALTIIEVIRKEGIICNLQWLLHGVGNPPVYQSEVFNPKKETVTSWEFDQEIRNFKSLHQNNIILEVNDDSMKPYLIYGDVVGGQWLEDFSKEFFNKKLCILCVDDMDLLCRWVESTPYENFLGLSTLNPSFNNSLNFLGKERVVQIAPIRHIWKKIS